MRDYDLRVIREISLFSTMSDENFDDLVKMAYLQKFPGEVQLIASGDPADFLHILVEGSVELYDTSNDRKTTLVVLRPVSSFNLSSVLEDAKYLLSARTKGNARVLMIPAENVRRQMEADPAFAQGMVAELAMRYRWSISALKEQKLRTGQERLAKHLLRMNKNASRGGRFKLTEDRHTLASILGITPEYLSRAFSKLKDHGVEVHGNNICLTNLKNLKRFAKPNSLIDNR